MKSGKEFNRLKNYKVKAERKMQILNEDEKELLKLANKYP